MQRRNFLAASLALPTALAATTTAPASEPRTSAPGNFKVSLKGDAIGLNLGAEEQLDAAIKTGYDALSVPGWWVADWSKAQRMDFAKKAKDNGISWGANGLPIDFRKTQEQYDKELAALPREAAHLRELGITRIGTWIISSHDTLTYNENMRLHADRLRGAAQVLKKEGIDLGLEYLGTTAVRQMGRFAFLSTGKELRELIALIGEPNVGVVLDSYHWYTARETAADLKAWKPEQIIAVDLNDANAQLTLDQQTDVARELPLATGVIDIVSFLKTLHEIGYAGPVRAEPFSSTLNGMKDELAIQATYDAVTMAIEKALG